MKKRTNLIVLFYVLYFSWLFTIVVLWPNPNVLTVFLLIIAAFYFLFLYEKKDFIFFSIVYIGSFLVGRYLANDPTFANRGFPPLGIPFWPIAWGVSSLAFRKFYILINTGYTQPV